MPNYRSGFERTLATSLKARGVSFEYETLKLPYTISHTYSPDIILANGVIVEAKGRFMKGETAKMKAVKAAHLHLDLRLCFMNAHAKIPGQKQTHAEWADRNGFLWSDGVIPDDWTQ